MPAPQTSNKPTTAPPWEFSPRCEARALPTNTREQARWGLAPYLQSFLPQRSESETRAVASDEAVAGRLPDLAWDAAADAFELAYRSVSGRPGGVALVSPGGESEAVLSTWASSRGYEFPPAGPRTELREAESWCAPPAAEVLVVPDLGAHLLRHPTSLKHLRGWLRNLAGQPRFVVGCSAWGWDYLKGVLDIDACVHTELVPQPLSGDELAGWLPALQATPKPDLVEAYYPWLSRASLGSVSIARALWRRSLLTRPEGPGVELAHPDQIELPKLPEGSGTWEAVVLDTLLIHGALREELLLDLLSVQAGPIYAALRRLERSGLLAREGDALAVEPEGVPAAVWFLKSQGWKPSWV